MPLCVTMGYPAADFPAARLPPPSGSTAESLVLVGLILQVLGGVIALVGIAWFFGFSLLFPYPFAWAAVAAAAVGAAAILAFLYFAYTLSYDRIRKGKYQEAQAATLVLGILSLFLGVIPGILYIIAYVKLGDAVREQQGFGPGFPPAYVAPPPAASLPPQVACKGCGRVYPLGQFGFCPGCGQRLGP